MNPQKTEAMRLGQNKESKQKYDSLKWVFKADILGVHFSKCAHFLEDNLSKKNFTRWIE